VVVESRPSCTSSTSGGAGAGTARSSGMLSIYSSLGHPVIHLTGQVQGLRLSFKATPADTEAEPPQTAQTAPASIGCAR
jgi:hypothetical protein